MGLDGFRLARGDLGWIGAGLARPECILTTERGDIYTSDKRGGVSHIRPDGTMSLYHGQSVTGGPLAANGFAMLADGTFVIAPNHGGPVQRLHRDGRVEVFLAEVDGVTLHTPNFVLRDTDDRLWICTQADRPRDGSVPTFHRDTREGRIILVDARGARIVAEGLGFPNELRVDPTGQWLYANETLAGGLLRHPLRADGSLGPAELVHQFDNSNFLDGFTLDAEGGAWLTALCTNRLWHVAQDGTPTLVMEDAETDQTRRLVEHQRTTGVSRAFLYEDPGPRLPNIASITFGGPDLRTAYLGSLMGEALPTFRAPVAGMRPAHWTQAHD